LVLLLAAVARLVDVGDDRAALFAYDFVVGLIAVGLFADLLWGRWAQSALTGLVVDLGEPAAASRLRDRLARTLADPTLVVGYWLPEQGGYVDEVGRPVELPSPGLQRAVTSIEEDGRNVAVLVHDAAVLDDRSLIEAVASATRLAVSNARLQAQVRGQVAEVEASRRRIVEAADAQRRRLGEELRQGAERRLERVQHLASDLDPELQRELQAAHAELREFARGIHPASLTSGGLAIALAELAARSPVPVEVSADAERHPRTVEAAVYFLCSEALANVAKHSGATRARILVSHSGARLTIEISDDGVGGADVSKGSGLRGLADRLEALGGELHLDSPSGRGTRLIAQVPLDDLA
jgi:signal transduction histidine kinase